WYEDAPEPAQSFAERAREGGVALTKIAMDVYARAGVVGDARPGARDVLAMPPAPRCNNCGQTTGRTRCSTGAHVFCNNDCCAAWTKKLVELNRSREEALARSQNFAPGVRGLRG